jgi:hypothetical protein
MELRYRACFLLFVGLTDCTCCALQPLALFRGMSVPMATVPLIHAVMFSGYGSAKRYLAESAAHDKPWFPPDDSRRPSHAAGSPHGILTVADKGVLTLDDEIDESDLDLWQITTAGGWSGFVNSFIVGPVELVKVQLQVQAADMKTGHSMRIAGLESRVFTGPVDFAVEAVKRHGWRAAFQGMVPTTVVETLACASQFYSYEVTCCPGLPCPLPRDVCCDPPAVSGPAAMDDQQPARHHERQG